MGILFKIKILGFRQIIRTIASVCKHGLTLLALLDSVKNTNSKQDCIQDDHQQLSYKDLYGQSLAMAYLLNKKYGIGPKSKVVIVSANSVAFVKSLFAVSGLGADVFLLNPNQKKEYFGHFLDTQKTDLIISDTALADYPASYNIPFVSYNSITGLHAATTIKNIVKRKKGNIVILSSGSKGKPKAEKRKVSAIKYLNPLIDSIEKLHLKENRSVLISVPIFHGYGLAALFLSVFMAKKIYLTAAFNAEKTLQLLQEQQVDCWIVVPLMIQKVYALPNVKITPLKSIITGGDVLPPGIIGRVHKVSNVQIYNMYGTSQTGVCTLATNAHLQLYPNTIGKAITGIATKIVDSNGNAVPTGTNGMLHVKCSWSSDNNKNRYVFTGDIVSKNSEGYYFYKGRHDDLMVIGGENVYPAELEDVIYKNAAIAWVKATNITNDNHITKIHVDIVLHEDTDFNHKEFLAWIADCVPGYMIPKSVAVLKEAVGTKLI